MDEPICGACKWWDANNSICFSYGLKTAALSEPRDKECFSSCVDSEGDK